MLFFPQWKTALLTGPPSNLPFRCSDDQKSFQKIFTERTTSGSRCQDWKERKHLIPPRISRQKGDRLQKRFKLFRQNFVTYSATKNLNLSNYTINCNFYVSSFKVFFLINS